MSSCMDQDRPWEEQPSRDYHNEIRAERDALRTEVTRLTRERDEFRNTLQLHAGDCMSLNNEVELFRSHWNEAEARAEAAERKLAMAVEAIESASDDLEEASKDVAIKPRMKRVVLLTRAEELKALLVAITALEKNDDTA